MSLALMLLTALLPTASFAQQTSSSGVRAVDGYGLASVAEQVTIVSGASNPAVDQSTLSDSVYREARSLLNRGEWRRAATLFEQIAARRPPVPLAADALYWQAFALYRIGGIEELRRARLVLEDRAVRFPRSEQVEAATLMTRVTAALADRGDAAAAQRLHATAATAVDACDAEDAAVRASALSALVHTDPATARPILRRVLERRDTCSAPLRRVALVSLDDSIDPVQRQTVLASVARRDPVTELRVSAVGALAELDTDGSAERLEELLRTETDSTVQRRIVRSLGTMQAPRARQAIRSTVERATAPEEWRIEAILGLAAAPQTSSRTVAAQEQAGERAMAARAAIAAARVAFVESTTVAAARRLALEAAAEAEASRRLALDAAERAGAAVESNRIMRGSSPIGQVQYPFIIADSLVVGEAVRNARRVAAEVMAGLTFAGPSMTRVISAADASWLRGVYPRLESIRLKAAAVRVLAPATDTATRSWVRALVLRDEEPMEIRVNLLVQAGRTLSIADLQRLYDTAPNRTLREQVIQVWGRRQEPECLDRLAEIVRKETDPTLRRAALGAIQASHNPRAPQVLLNLIDRPE